MTNFEGKPTTNLADDLDKVLADHEQAIGTIEQFIAHHAQAASLAVDPTRLQAAIDRIRNHSARLSDLMVKFPVLK